MNNSSGPGRPPHRGRGRGRRGRWNARNNQVSRNSTSSSTPTANSAPTYPRSVDYAADGHSHRLVTGSSYVASFPPPATSAQSMTRTTSNTAQLNNSAGSSVRRQSISAPAFGGDWISVLVGPNDSPTPFSLHKELASKESSFIQAAFRHEWKESEQMVIRLPDHDPEHFKLFLFWAYNRVFFSASQGATANQASEDREWNLLAGAWALGAFLQAPDFKDAVVDAIIEKVNISIECAQTMHEIIYPNTHTDAPIRKLLADIASWRWDLSTLKATKNDTTWSDFYYDLSAAVIEKHHSTDRTVIAPWLKDPCAYHEHRLNESICYKIKYM